MSYKVRDFALVKEKGYSKDIIIQIAAIYYDKDNKDSIKSVNGWYLNKNKDFETKVEIFKPSLFINCFISTHKKKYFLQNSTK